MSAIPPGDRHEAQYVASELLRLVRDETIEGGFREMAVMYRTNRQSRAIEEVLVRSGIPYHLVGGKKFYERREVRDVLAYLRLIANPADNDSFFRILNVFPDTPSNPPVSRPRPVSRLASFVFFSVALQPVCRSSVCWSFLFWFLACLLVACALTLEGADRSRRGASGSGRRRRLESWGRSSGFRATRCCSGCARS